MVNDTLFGHGFPIMTWEAYSVFYGQALHEQGQDDGLPRMNKVRTGFKTKTNKNATFCNIIFVSACFRAV